MNAKIFVIRVEATMYLLLCNLHDYSLNDNLIDFEKFLLGEISRKTHRLKRRSVRSQT